MFQPNHIKTPAWAALFWVFLVGNPVIAADRFYGYVPINTKGTSELASRMIDQENRPLVEGSEDALTSWNNYLRLWREHHADPTNSVLRRYLGLRQINSGEPQQSNTTAYAIKVKRGRAAPRFLKWKPRTYEQVDTPHFTIHSVAQRRESLRAAKDLEDAYWLWTQWFFPFWNDAPKVRRHLAKLDSTQPIATQLANSAARLSSKKRMRVVLFHDVDQYVRALRADNPGVERSTGFYHDAQRTIFLFASSSDQNSTQWQETLQHELVHQLFREASLSRLQQTMPGEQRDFWLVEGIAGYFESMVRRDGIASVGGWDAPRMQYARYRVLAGGDQMPMGELRRDGRLAVQERDDLARWYAHAILRVHWLLDGGKPNHVQWLFQHLADVYQMDLEASGFEPLDHPLNDPSQEDSLSVFLRVSNDAITANKPLRHLKKLCFARCPLTGAAIGTLAPLVDPQWVDLSDCEIDDDAVRNLMPNPSTLQQLSLERTAITDGIATWLTRATALEEADLSWTSVSDRSVEALQDASQLEVLWLTGSAVTNDAMDLVGKLSRLQRLDVQKSHVTEARVQSLRAAYPKVQFNPLQLRREQP